MTPVEFRQWRLRMGGLTLNQTVQALEISFGSARGYSEGTRKVPAYIAKLCKTLESEHRRNEIEMSKNKPPKNKPSAQQKPVQANGEVNLANVLAIAYRQVRARKSPAIAMTLSAEILEQEMADALEILSQNGVEIHVAAAHKNAG